MSGFLSIGGAGGVVGGSAAFDGNAVTFSSDYLYKSGTLTGATDSPELTVSFWFKPDGSGDYIFYSARTGVTRLEISVTNGAPDTVTVSGNNASGSGTFTATVSSDDLFDGNWHHFIMSVDRDDLANRWARIDGNPYTVVSWTSDVNYLDDFDFATGGGNVLIGGIGLSPSASYAGDMAAFYLDQTYYAETDPNVALFITDEGTPVNPPSGLIKLIGSTDSWHTNKGTGGGFTENGTLATSANLPVETPAISAYATTAIAALSSVHNGVRFSGTDGLIIANGSSGFQATYFELDATDGGISLGTTISIDNNTTSKFSNPTPVKPINSTDALAVFRDSGDQDVKAAIVRNTGGSLSKGTTVLVDADTVNGDVSHDVLSSTKAIVVYADSSNDEFYARIITMSGTTISAVGAENVIGASLTNVSYISVVALNSTEAIVAFGDATNISFYGLDISGDTVTEGDITEVAHGDDSIQGVTGGLLSGERAIFCLDYNPAPFQSFAIAASKSTTTVTVGSLFEIASDADAASTGAAMLSSYGTSKALVNYASEFSGGDKVGLQILNVSGLVISDGGQYNDGTTWGGSNGSGDCGCVLMSETQGVYLAATEDEIKSLRFR